MRRLLAGCALWLVAVGGAAGAETPPSGRVLVATVGPTIFYLDELTVRGVPDDVLASGAIRVPELEIQSLRRLIRDAVIDQEIAARGITIRDDLVTRRARAMQARRWQLLGPTDEERERALEQGRALAGAILEALRLWGEDPENGDAFAARVLEPLGVSKAQWKWLTSQSNNAAFLARLEEGARWTAQDRQGHLRVPPEDLPVARRLLAQEELKRAVTAGVAVSRAELKRLLDLVQRTEWIELVVASGPRGRLERLRARLGTDAAAAIEEATLQGLRPPSRDRLTASRLWPAGADTEPDLHACLLAIHAKATSAGTVSDVFEAAGSDGRRTWLLYVAERQTRQSPGAPREAIAERARAALGRVKRDQRFELWLWQRMRERTTIHVPRFNEALELREGS
jgi:hypothetical protein